VEISGARTSLTGALDVSAPAGKTGDILLDPVNLTIIAGKALSGDQDAALFDSDGTLLASAADTPNNQISNGELQSLTGNISLQASNDLTVAAPITLTGLGQSLTLQAGNALTVQSNAPISAFGAITLAASGRLSVNGAVTSNNFAPITLSAGSGGIALNASVDAGNINPVQITATGDIVQTGASSLTQAPRSEFDLIHVRGGVVTVSTSGNIIQSGYVALEGDQALNLTAGGEIVQNGPMTTGSPITFPGAPGSPVVGSDIFGPNGVTIRAGGNLAQSGNARISTLAGGTASLTIGGDVTQAGFGELVGDTIAVSVAGGLAQSQNAIIASVAGGTVRTTTISTGGNVAQNDAAALSGGDGVVLNVGGSLTQSAGASIASSNGPVAVAAMNGSLSLAGGISGARVGMTAGDAITLSGLLSAPTITVDNGTGTTTVRDGATIQTSGVVRPDGTLTSDQLPRAASGEGGLYITTGQFSQTGQLTVSGAPSVIRIDSSAGIQFASRGGLVALDSWLILALSNRTTATGTINVAAMDVSYAPIGGGTSLFGSVRGLTGATAAAVSNIEPATNIAFQLNNCEIAVSVCTVQVRPQPSTLVLIPYLFSMVLGSRDKFGPGATIGGIDYQPGVFVLGSVVYPADESDLLLPLVSDLEY
jgi:hypothetical protein